MVDAASGETVAVIFLDPRGRSLDADDVAFVPGPAARVPW